jgi:hypothetical protein
MDHVKIYRKLHPLVLNYQTAKWGFEGELAQCIYSSKKEAKSARHRAAIAYEAWMKSQPKPPKPLKVKPPRIIRDEPRSPRLLIALSLVGLGVKRLHAAKAAGIGHQAVYNGMKRYPKYEAQRRARLIALLTHANL